MKEHHSFFRYDYCIIFEFNSITCFSASIATTGQYFGTSINSNLKRAKESKLAIVCNSSDGNILYQGDSADEEWKLQENRENNVYVRNVFLELGMNFLNTQDGESNKNDIHHKAAVQGIIRALEEEIEHWEKKLNSSRTQFQYVFNVPTHWNYAIREELIRPIFIQAAFIDKHDHVRLIFFTRLESTFRFIQSEDKSFEKVKIQNGKQYMMCTLDFGATTYITLDLFTARYPSFTSVENNYVPQALKSISFTAPFKRKEGRERIQTYLENKCGLLIPTKLLDVLGDAGKVYTDKNITKMSLQSFQACQIFKNVNELHHEQYRLKQNEIEFIESITIGDIYADFPTSSLETALMNQIGNLLTHTEKANILALIIFTTDTTLCSFDYNFVKKRVEHILKTFGTQQSRYTLMTFQYNEVERLHLTFNANSLMKSSSDLIIDYIKEFNKNRDPIILPSNPEEGQPNPVYFINIDILPTNLQFVITHVGEGGFPERPAERIQWYLYGHKCSNIQPLDNFITLSGLGQISALRMTNRVKLFVENAFGDYLKKYSDITQQNDIRHLFMCSGSTLLDEILIDVEENWVFEKDSSDFTAINCQSGYAYFFLVTYLYYLNKAVKDKLDESFGESWRDKSIGYAISIEKSLLDNLFVSEKINELLFACGILIKDDERYRADVSSYGEDILPSIQKKLGDLQFKMKSYFVVAQLHPAHIRLALHQVVRLSSADQNAATIIVEDEIIQTENVYDTMCKVIWVNMVNNQHINYCAEHSNKENIAHHWESAQANNDIFKHLKPCVLDILNDIRLGMDHIKYMNISTECACTIGLSQRYVLDIGFKPIIQKIAKIAAASLTNHKLFGCYEVNYVFVLGNPFNLPPSSVHYSTHNILVQKALDTAIHLKGKDAQGFSLLESFDKLLIPVTLSKPYMYDRFIYGALRQVAGKTYGIRLVDKRNQFQSFRRENCTALAPDDGSYMLVLKKGQPIPIMGLTIELRLAFEYVGCTRVSIIEAQNPNEVVYNGLILLPKDSTGVMSRLRVMNENGSSTQMVLKFKQINHNHSLHISLRAQGGEDTFPQIQRRHIDLEEPLTLAYT